VEGPIEVVWEGERCFRGGSAGGATLLVDGNRGISASPVEALVVALASCAAIDVVDILAKRRTPPSALRVRVEYIRAPDPPRRLVEIDLHFSVAVESDRSHVQRALELSFERYCSVSASLAPDTRLTWTLETEAGRASPSPP
jgi:putative redox protein